MDQYLTAIYMAMALQMKLVSGFNRGEKEFKKKCTLRNNLHNETSKMQPKFKCYKQKTIT
jgi:hypothetical protein